MGDLQARAGRDTVEQGIGKMQPGEDEEEEHDLERLDVQCVGEET